MPRLDWGIAFNLCWRRYIGAKPAKKYPKAYYNAKTVGLKKTTLESRFLPSFQINAIRPHIRFTFFIYTTTTYL